MGSVCAIVSQSPRSPNDHLGANLRKTPGHDTCLARLNMAIKDLGAGGLVVAVGLAAVLFGGCETTIIADGDDDDPQCCLAEPVCPEGSVQVEACPNGGNCFSEEACCSEILCQVLDQNCGAVPVCEPYETQVESCDGLSGMECRSVTLCGSTIYCAAEVFCDGYPTCDPGDEEVADCLEQESCYVAERCGASILCRDAALPQHGCPPDMPVEGDPCTDEGRFCDYPTGDDCFDSWLCQFQDKAPAWTWVGGGCGAG